jgi:predicted enzyme related to lactoylglutathione lyase
MRVSKVYFMLWVAEVDRASRFYKAALGLHEAYRSPNWTELRFGDSTFGEATVALHSGPPQRRPHHLGLGFEVDDLPAACDAVTAAGGELVAGPTERIDEGIRVADCADPDGNRFSLSQRLT